MSCHTSIQAEATLQHWGVVLVFVIGGSTCWKSQLKPYFAGIRNPEESWSKDESSWISVAKGWPTDPCLRLAAEILFDLPVRLLGIEKIGGFLWCRISKFRAWFPTSKTTRWRPGAYKQILPKMDEMFWSLTKRKTYIHLFFIFPTCHRFRNARFNNSNPWSITFFPTHIQGPGLPIWKSFSNSCDRNCTSKNSGSCVGGKPSRNGHRNKRTLCLHDRDDLHAKK